MPQLDANALGCSPNSLERSTNEEDEWEWCILALGVDQ